MIIDGHKKFGADDDDEWVSAGDNEENYLLDETAERSFSRLGRKAFCWKLLKRIQRDLKLKPVPPVACILIYESRQ